jgi:hypothetical protein
MPAQSQQQQKLFGLALSVKRGETPRSEASEDVLGIVDSMTEKEIEDFASTSHKGLPKKVEQQIREMVREIMRERAISELELSKDDMEKLHSDGEVEVDGEKVTFEEGKKRFKRQDGIGKAKYTISYHDGKKKHKDGSDFFDIKIFKNKKDLSDFVGSLVKQGYKPTNESVNEVQLKKGDKIRFKNGQSIYILGPKGDGYDYQDGRERGHHPKGWFDMMIKSKKAVVESVNERLTNSDIKRMEGLHSYKKMDEALKSLVFIGKELYEEGFEKPEITEFILKKVQRRLFLQLKESTNEGIEPQIKKIAHFTGTRPEAVEDFVSKHALNFTKLLKYVQKGGLPQRMEFVSALAGRPNNPKQKKIIKQFQESVNEGYSTEEKRIVMMAVRKIAKYMNVDLKTAMNYVLGAGQELERDIKKGKIKK